MKTQGENEALLNNLEHLTKPTVVDLGFDAQVIVSPNAMRVENVRKYLDENLERPRRMKGTSKHFTAESLIDWTKRFASPADSAVFADEEASSIVSVIDYNGASGPNWGQHRGVYRCPLSDEWNAWNDAVDETSKRPWDQATFAQFLEERVLDVLDPDHAGDGAKRLAEALGVELASPQRLLTLSRGLRVHVDSKVSQNLNLSSGEGQLQFSEEHKNEKGEPLRVPGGFAIAIPVYTHGEKYSVPVRLLYSVSRGAVYWRIQLRGAEATRRDAFEGVCNLVAEKTLLPVFRGVAE